MRRWLPLILPDVFTDGCEHGGASGHLIRPGIVGCGQCRAVDDFALATPLAQQSKITGKGLLVPRHQQKRSGIWRCGPFWAANCCKGYFE